MTGTAGTLRLARVAVRRDRVALSAWVIGLGLFTAAFTAMSVQNLPTQADLVQETQLMATNPALRMLGLASGASVGGYAMIRGYVTLAVLAALMSTLAVVRHTRQNEELGRAEMVGATGVGRYAELAAAVLVASVANLVLWGAVTLAMAANGQPWAGGAAAGASVAAVGLAFVGVSAVTCQLAATTRGAIGLASAVLGAAFLLSGIGNMLGTVDDDGVTVTSAWPAWLSPIGWGQQMRPFGGERWWPLALFFGCFAGLVLAAFALAGRRDLGRGVLAERRGPGTARRSLLSPAGLVWRLQRGALLGWMVGLLGFGLVFGAMTEQIQDVSGNALEWYTRMGGSDRIVDAYRASIIEMVGMAVAIYVVQMLVRLRVDETGGTLESVLATGVSRPRWVLGHALDALAGSVVLVVVFGVSMGLATGRVLGDTPTQVREMTAAGLVQIPAVVVVGGAVVALVGWLPRWSVTLSWVLLAVSILLGPLFGPALGLPQWAQNLSPFTLIPKVPAVDLTVAPLLGLTAACLVLVAAGIGAVRRRDLVLPA